MSHQKFYDQISDIRVHYSPPPGECLLAIHDSEPVGILILKDLGDQLCEMNRMFVRPAGRGFGTGRLLVQSLQERAREMGFQTMVLSALLRHHEALALYQSAGFQITDPANKTGSSDAAVHMTLNLVAGPGQ